MVVNSSESFQNWVNNDLTMDTHSWTWIFFYARMLCNYFGFFLGWYGLVENFITAIYKFCCFPPRSSFLSYYISVYYIIGLCCFIMLECWISFFSWTDIDEDSRRWMVHFIHQSGMLLVWLALKPLTQLLGKSTKRNKR